jgi:uncharacterized protein YjlB
MTQSVQCYFLSSNSDAPNNTLPVLHYHGVLPSDDATEDAVTRFLTANTWEKRVCPLMRRAGGRQRACYHGPDANKSLS